MSVTAINHVAFIVFVCLTIVHPIADFMLPRKKWGAWHGLVSLNPFHCIIDMVAIHRGFIHTYAWSFRINKEYVDEEFWPLLGADQLMHAIANLAWAYIISILLVRVIL